MHIKFWYKINYDIRIILQFKDSIKVEHLSEYKIESTHT